MSFASGVLPTPSNIPGRDGCQGSKGMTRWVRWSEYQKLSRTAQLSVYESLLSDEHSIVQKIAS